ncbi:MAG TPA: carbon-nitrogen hydrolase family protein [Solirubrobacteraceae bacterium]|nr:carbon-nitrogen hydrolase family protein [Solirubrobacteraceae bacterium]
MRVAAVQLNSSADAAENLEAADALTRAAARDGASLVVLPEKWTAIGSSAQLRDASEGLDGPASEWARATARELDIDLVAGSILERRGGERLSNTSLHVDPHGEIRAVYRKLHMFDVEIEGRAYRESELEDAGDEIVLSQTAGGVGLGMAICYDLRFPELFRILAVRGAEIFSLPSAFTLATTRDHWEVLVRARAIENQAFVVAANQFGAHPAGHHSGGRSMIVDPWGVVLAQAPDGVGHVIADLDLEQQRAVRERLPALANRRPDAYRWPQEGTGAGAPPMAARVPSQVAS